MRSQRCSLFILSLLLIISGCSKSGGETDDGGGPPHEENPSDITAPVITISDPTPNQVFNGNAVINMRGRITDDYGLYRGTVKLINDANGVELKNQSYEIHGVVSYDFSVTYNPTVTTPSDFTVIVSFMDHGLNTTTRSVKIKVNP